MSLTIRCRTWFFVHALMIAVPMLVCSPITVFAQTTDSCRHGAVFSFEPERTEAKEIQSVHYTDVNGRQGTIAANANQILFHIPSNKIEELDKFVADNADCEATVHLNDLKLETESIAGLFGPYKYVDVSRIFNAIVPIWRMDITKLRNLIKSDNVVSIIIN